MFYLFSICLRYFSAMLIFGSFSELKVYWTSIKTEMLIPFKFKTSFSHFSFFKFITYLGFSKFVILSNTLTGSFIKCLWVFLKENSGFKKWHDVLERALTWSEVILIGIVNTVLGVIICLEQKSMDAEGYFCSSYK